MGPNPYTQQIDFNGTVGKMLAAALMGVAEVEQEKRRERQKAGIEAAKERGFCHGRKVGTTKAKAQRGKVLLAEGKRCLPRVTPTMKSPNRWAYLAALSFATCKT